MTVIRRGTRTGLRLRDPDSAARRQFSGLHWFPIDEHYRIHAHWHPYNPPHKIPITNVLGMTEEEATPVTPNSNWAARVGGLNRQPKTTLSSSLSGTRPPARRRTHPAAFYMRSCLKAAK